MSTYTPPLKDASFVLDQLIGLNQLCEKLQLEDINTELATVIIEEAGKLASDILAPLNSVGDEKGSSVSAGKVQETAGFADAYQQFVENGWATLTGPEEFGGQNLPNVIGTAVNELWHSSNMSFALCPMLSQGAVEALIAHGSETLKAHYLPPLISGEWTGTMNLTEPNAGSDLAAVAAKAKPEGDHYKISGQKIFITWGDHQMTSNIVHLVLARLPNAPAGVKGISLFIVPKYCLDEQGQPAELNDVSCISLEHKMGIHGSPTCVMSFGDNDGAIGYLVGEENKGLSYMFTMMNHARQAVGLQGLSISERAYQQALQYSQERFQGSRRDGQKIAIIDHPDVRRMLMAMKAGNEAMRALAYSAAADIDHAHSGDEAAKARVELYTPIVKGWMTELAQELTSLNIQVHGGMGFIEETGAAQHYRDARILPIYEGTTGIQALDLIGRKTLFDKGMALKALHADINETLNQLTASDNKQLQALQHPLKVALESAVSAGDWILENTADDPQTMGNVSFDNLMMMGYLTGGWLLARSALLANKLITQENPYGDPFLQGKIATASFYAEHYLPRVKQHADTVLTGLSNTFALDIEQMQGV
ncbi:MULTISPECIES: acyl-CoA dehydrogenase [unclassified Neptuniibacter]|uniref:acyl-CoA dehydrogenase n=1 Tax=unclassified Neptuniibacter TaxID=2630693 RepID=UPI0026E3A723|nr:MULTISPECIES: acyl-CoA dehydrogenase [unclassified Neptuniibacter]MDO6515325.1 acyl-CoA dehydrogenase [Neptuniibacter sp. 2_MG-2023]MDO6592310.1 acyl-CoA dehydrogenase [Neptuniibacter sp. 1_MG-2023]